MMDIVCEAGLNASLRCFNNTPLETFEESWPWLQVKPSLHVVKDKKLWLYILGTKTTNGPKARMLLCP
jgi:hypothetical protein